MDLPEQIVFDFCEFLHKVYAKYVEVCDKAFSTQGKVVRHIRDVHLKIKGFACNSCDKAFDTTPSTN